MNNITCRTVEIKMGGNCEYSSVIYTYKVHMYMYVFIRIN